MRKIGVLLLAAGVLAGSSWAGSPKVAVVYSSWPDGKASFVEEYDAGLQSLGWEFEKFENTRAAELVGRLDEFDIVIASSVANYENTQDMTQYKEQWLAFLERGGCLVISDASYPTALNLWVNTFGDEFKLASKMCIAHTSGTPESRQVQIAPHPLMSVPNDVGGLLRDRKQCWAHLEEWPEGWRSLVSCKDGESLYLARSVGEGLLIVTSYFSFKGTSGAEVSAPLLENVWLDLAQRRAGIELSELDFGDLRPGPATVTLGLGNPAKEALTVSAQVRVEPADGEPSDGEAQTLTLEPGAEGTLTLPYRIATRGEMIVRVTLADGEGNALADWPKKAIVPPAIRAALKRKHLYPIIAAPGGETPPGRTDLEAVLRLAPDSDVPARGISLEYSIDGARLGAIRPDGAELIVLRTPTRELPEGEHQLKLRLTSGDDSIGETTAQFFVHSTPSVAIREDGVTLVDGAPFFPFGFYHVSWPFDMEARIRMARDLSEGGFNITHCGIKTRELDDYGRFLDVCADVGVKVITEFQAPREETIKGYKDHPAVLGWNPGDEPAARGVSAETMYSRFDTFKQLDPNHLVYTVICRPDEYCNYARGTDVLAPDPYPVPNRPVTDVYDLLKAARVEADRYDTTLWGVLQCFGNYGAWTRPPSATELRSMTYLALLAGVKGIIYYTYADGEWAVMDNPEQWQAARDLVPEIKTLAPALMDGKRRSLAEGENGIYAGYWQHEANAYIVVANGAGEPGEFSLAVPGESVEELFDEGTPVGLKDGQLTGSLEALQVRVFRTR